MSSSPEEPSAPVDKSKNTLTRKQTIGFKSPVRDGDGPFTASEPTPISSNSNNGRRSLKKKLPDLPSADVAPSSALSLYWYKTPVFGRCPNRAFRAHSATVMDSSLWLFGGCSETHCWRDVFKLDLDSGRRSLDSWDMA
jgi:hypothetical protein